MPYVMIETRVKVTKAQADIAEAQEGVATANANINGLVQVINQNQKRVQNVEEHTGTANPFDAPAPSSD